MSRAAVTLAAAAAAAMLISSCAGQPTVEVRSIGAPLDAAASDSPLNYGQAALALGNPGLALQQFRLALRTSPASTDALAGIASAYDAMGRADLARRYYQEALALAPADLPLLRRYATSLARHGATDEAQAVIAEIALRSRAPASQWVIEAPRPPAPAIAATDIAPSTRELALPKARLERLSLGEIALVTTGAPLWTPLAISPGPHRVRLLNAARREGLAARRQLVLRNAGWRNIVIGDAPHRRAESLLLFPVGQRETARRIADRLSISAIRPGARTDILILLGGDQA